jgi:hypothetical protein
MLKSIILIEGENDYQCDTFEEVVRKLIHENYYEMTEKQRKEEMRMKALANCLGNDCEVIDKAGSNSSVSNKMIIEDEMTYILSLLQANKIALLERVDSNVFTRGLDKSSFKKNYVLVNKFAKDLLLKYIGNRSLNEELEER